MKCQARVFKAVVICEWLVIVEGQAFIVGHASRYYSDVDVAAIEGGELGFQGGYFYCVESGCVGEVGDDQYDGKSTS